MNTERRVFFLDTLRLASDGVVQPLRDSVLMVVAIRVFSAGDGLKSLLSASHFIGWLLVAPVSVMLIRRGVQRSGIMTWFTGLGAFFFGVAMLASDGVFFVLASSLALLFLSLRQPFFTGLYQEFYPQERRAQRLTLGVIIMTSLTLGGGLVYGKVLQQNLGSWRILAGLGVLALGGAAVALSRLPGGKAAPRRAGWLEALTLPFRRPLFGYVTLSWMIMGLANLLTLPLRAVYLAEPERGLGLSPFLVGIFLGVIPAGMKLVLAPVWAWFYDKVPFIAARTVINFFIALGQALFFMGKSLPVIALASFLFGIGAAGAPYIWQLWVTRIAPPEETEAYQSSHVFWAGVRGALSPFLGFALLGLSSFRAIGFFAAGGILLATLLLLPLHRRKNLF